MHCTHRTSRTAFGVVLIGLMAFGPTGVARAGEQADLPAPRPEGPAPTPTGAPIIIPIGTSQRLAMKGRKIIKGAVNPKENVALVQPVRDEPREVLITGKESGTTQITLTAQDDTQETYIVHVEYDVSALRDLLRRAAPSANLQLIPASSNGAIIIAGNVAQSEDIDLIMRTAQSTVANPDRIINAMRVGGVMQVQLDVIVAYVARTELRRMSFDFLDVGQHHQFASNVGGGLVVPTTGSTLPTLGTGLQIPNTVGAPNGVPANFFLALYDTEQTFFGLLEALRNESLAKILAQPKLVTLSGRPASLLSGGQQAIPETAGLGSVSVRFEDFGTKLNFLPIVLGNGKIHLEVIPEVSNIDPSVGTSIAGTVVPGRNTQRVQTTVEMEDGQTLALGGLIQNTVTGTTTKVPVLGDLPFLGAAFSSKSYSETESELVVLVTPHLVDPMSCDQLPKHLPGQETRSPDDFELFLEGILEAPRGQREVCPHGHYVPAYKNGPTAESYPCGRGGCCGKGCGNGSADNCGAGLGEPAGCVGLGDDYRMGATPVSTATTAGASNSDAAARASKPAVLPTATEAAK
jgi:pilus assembly protein CpaC